MPIHGLQIIFLRLEELILLIRYQNSLMMSAIVTGNTKEILKLLLTFISE